MFGGGGVCHGQTTRGHSRVTCRVTPCEQQGMTKNPFFLVVCHFQYFSHNHSQHWPPHSVSILILLSPLFCIFAHLIVCQPNSYSCMFSLIKRKKNTPTPNDLFYFFQRLRNRFTALLVFFFQKNISLSSSSQGRLSGCQTARSSQ